MASFFQTEADLQTHHSRSRTATEDEHLIPGQVSHREPTALNKRTAPQFIARKENKMRVTGFGGKAQQLYQTYYGNVVAVEQDLVKFCNTTSFGSDLTEINIVC